MTPPNTGTPKLDERIDTELLELVKEALLSTSTNPNSEVEHFDIGRKLNVGNVRAELAHKITERLAPKIQAHLQAKIKEAERLAIEKHTKAKITQGKRVGKYKILERINKPSLGHTKTLRVECLKCGETMFRTNNRLNTEHRYCKLPNTGQKEEQL